MRLKVIGRPGMSGARLRFSEQLRRYLGRIADIEGGLRRVADGAGVDRASLEVFLNGQRKGLSMESLDKLIGWLELDLVASDSRYAIVLGELGDRGDSGVEEPPKEGPEKNRFIDDGKPF